MPTKTVMNYTVLCALVCCLFATSVDSAIVKWTSPVIDQPSGTAVDHITIAENAITDTSVLTVVATSSPDNNVNIAYAIAEQEVQNVFKIDAGTIKTIAPLDYETKSSYVIKVTADDSSGAIAGTATITIDVENVGPVFEQSSQSVCVKKGSIADYAITIIKASLGPNADPGSSVIYDNIKDSEIDSTEFAINPNTGIVTVATGNTLTEEHSYQLTIEASVGNEKDTMELQINVRECQGEAPSFEKDSETFCVKQGSLQGTVIDTFKAHDPENDEVSYAIAGMGHTDFNINENGTLSVSSFSQEAPKYEITVVASDTDGIGIMKLTIDVGDCFESGASSPITDVGVFASLLLLAVYFN